MKAPAMPGHAGGRSRRAVRQGVSAFALLLCLSSGAALAQPTVNGWFYGDGNDALYQFYANSENGSTLYSYFDAPNNRLYVALVVNRTNTNDLACSPQNNSAYTQSAGWPNHRNCKRASDSEFASFTLQCAPGSSTNSWAWQQALACNQTAGPPESNWVSNATCGNSSGTWPPSIVSSTSWVMNVNTYQAAAPATRAWNLYTHGTAVDNWKSPFLSTSPDNATLVPGYASGFSNTNGSGLFYQWEWSMVYEWSVNLGAGGANCGNQPVFFITGVSHHSPAKNGDEDDTFTPPPEPFSDWGDVPNSYGTTLASNGPRHLIKVNGPRLGTDIQAETNGQPTTGADGDGAEEDGVTANVNSNWTQGSTQSFSVTVSNAPSGALLGAWFDWNGDGDFADAGEFVSANVVNGVNTLNVTIPVAMPASAGFEWQSDTLYTRFRIFSSGAAAPGGSLTQADFVGAATDGEVEDYVHPPGTLPVTLNAFTSEGAAGGEVTVRWQTASETDNVAFELWGRVDGEWRPLTDLIQSRSMSSGLPQRYAARVAAPPGLTEMQLLDYDSKGRPERFGSFRLGESYGEFQRPRPIDWSGPRAERAARLGERGFADTARAGGPEIAERHGGDARGPARWKKLRAGEPLAGSAVRYHGASAVVVDARKGPPPGKGPEGGSVLQAGIPVQVGATTHVAVTQAGIQRVSYESLRDGGLDLAGVNVKDIAVTWRGQPVDRWISGSSHFGPGSAIEFLGFPPEGDDALYIDAALYQVAVDSSLALDPRTIGQGKAKSLSASYLRETWVDRPLAYHHQSPTGDPWVERSVLVRPGAPTTVTLDLPIAGPVAAGPSRVVVGLGGVTNLPDLLDPFGGPLPEHNVEVWARGPSSGFTYVTSSSATGHQDWTIQATVPAGLLQAGVNQVQLRFSTQYFLSLVVVDRYGAAYPSPYRGPSLDFAPDRWADGYRIDGLATPSVVAYAEAADGSLTRVDPRLSQSGGVYSAELRQMDAVRYWVTEAPHAPEVFTTEAPPDLLSGPAGLVVIAGSSLVGSWALDDYVAQRAAFDPVVVDVEDIYNAVGFGMALPSAITDYLRARDAIYPFSHVQVVGTDCYDRLNYISSCLSLVPLPTAPVNVSVFSPSQNRLVDLDGDGIADEAVGQFSVRSDAELATIVAKGAAWEASGLAGGGSALMIAEESDGLNDFSGQIERLGSRLGWGDVDTLHMADHSSVFTAQSALSSSLGAGRSVTVFSGHSSPTVWAFRSLLTPATAAALTNHGRPTIMVPLACETTYDISPNANVLGHQLLYAGDNGALAISGAVALSSLDGNEVMANHVLDGLKAGLTLGEAVLAGRRAIGSSNQELQDNWLTQGDVTIGLQP